LRAEGIKNKNCYIDNNENIKVRIDQKESNKTYDPFVTAIWEGLLKDIPEEYRKLEVLSEGWLIYAKVNSLSVYIPKENNKTLTEPKNASL